MGTIQNPKLLYLKAALFVFLGLLASGTLLALVPSWKIAGLLVIAIWAFARAYYFAFYVVEHYVDGDYRYAGLWDFATYAWKRVRKPSAE